MSDPASNPNLHSTPRVSKNDLPRQVGHTVRLVGELVANDGQALRVRCGDGEVAVTNQNGVVVGAWRHVEVIGVVMQDLSVAMSMAADLGEGFNLENYHEVIQLIPTHAPAVFGV